MRRYTAKEIEEACSLLCACASQDDWEHGVYTIGGGYSSRVLDLACAAMRKADFQSYVDEGDWYLAYAASENLLRRGWLPSET